MASQTTDTSENDAEVREKIATLQQKISDVKSECSGIKKDLDTIFGFTTATTVASGLGTVAAGGALVAGIKKSKTDKSADEIEQQLSQKKERLAYIDYEVGFFRKPDYENVIFREEKEKKDDKIRIESRKSRCSTQMKLIKNNIEKAKKNYFRRAELDKALDKCNDEVNSIDKVKTINEEIELLANDRNILCWKYKNKEEKDEELNCSNPKGCTPYIQSKNCLVKGSYKDLEEIDEKIRDLQAKRDGDPEYYKKNEECKKIADERFWIDIANDNRSVLYSIDVLPTLCGYRKAASSSYGPVFNLSYTDIYGDDYIPHLEEIEKELDMGLESFDKKYFSGYDTDLRMYENTYTEEARMLDLKKHNKRIATYKEKIALLEERPVLENEISELEKELEVLNVNSESTGNLRTGLMAGATVTSAVSTGTSIGATVNADKLAKKMSDCNQKLYELKIAKSELEALESTDKSVVEVGENATKILGACTGYNKNNINTVKNKMTASAIISGIGTATGATGTITSAMANSKKVREDDSVKGKKKEKNLNLTANIMAGITTGTSLSTTVISATAIADAKKDSKMAEECEAVLK